MAAELSDLPTLPTPQNQALVEVCLNWAEGSACDNETARLMAAEIRWLRHENGALRSPAASRHVLERLMPLCECAEIGVLQQACPIHGDGETFVAGVKSLDAGLRDLTERVTELERRTHSGRPLLAAELSQRRGAP